MTGKDPFEMWKKAFLMGVGATALTVEKMQELANELVERGEMSQKDAMSFSEDLRSRAMKEKEQFESRMKESVESYMKTAVKSMGLVTREEYEALKEEIENLKAGNGAKKTAKAK